MGDIVKPEPMKEHQSLKDYLKYFNKVAMANDWNDVKKTKVLPSMLRHGSKEDKKYDKLSESVKKDWKKLTSALLEDDSDFDLDLDFKDREYDDREVAVACKLMEHFGFGNMSEVIKPYSPQPTTVINKTSNVPFRHADADFHGQDEKARFEKEALEQHNIFRRKHGCPDLVLDRKLCNYAQEWANKLAQTGESKHRDSNDYGENLYGKSWSGMRYKPNGAEPVQSWYDEIEKYDFKKGGHQPGTGHFTQVVWRESKRMGIAFVHQKPSKKHGGNWESLYVVANYDPPGNYIGQFDKNVPKPLK